MKKLFYSFVTVSVLLLALFTSSQLSTAQNRSEAATESENQEGLRTQTQSSDYILSQIIGSPLQKIYLGAAIPQKVPINSTSNTYVTSSVNGIFPTIPGTYQTTDSQLTARETFETKLNSTCNLFLYSKYLSRGQSGNETTRSIADDSLIAYLLEPVWMSCTIPNRDVNSGGQDTPINLAFEIPTAPLALPSAPQNLQASPGNGQNFLGWQAPSSNGGATIMSYRVFRGTTSSNQQLVTSGGCANLSSVLACTDTGLTNGQIYYYIVSAVNSFGQGPPSNQVNATPTGATIPGAPRNLQTSPGNGQNFLGWQAPTSNGGATITSYRVFRGTTSSNQQLVTSGGCANLSSVLACTDTGLTNGQIYYYIVSAVNSFGQGPPSNQVNATPTGATIPGAPRNLQTSPSNGQNFLGWQAPTSNGGATITSYRVFRGTTSSNQQPVTSGGCANLSSVLACTDTGLTNGQIYYYIVSAVNSVGQGPPSNQVTATPVGPTFPDAPQNLQTSPSNGQNFLGWQAPASNGGAPIIGYRVFRGTTSSNQMVVTSGGCANLGTVLACTDTGLTNGQIYYYFVSAYNSVNQGPGSNIVSATPAAAPVVFSINPNSPVSSPATQDVFVSGTNFKPNLTVDISSPGGGVTTLSGEQIQNFTETSFIMRATLSAPGSWSIKVKNPDNQESAAFPFTVSSGGTVPFISSINPISPTANGADQFVTVTGGNFQNGVKVNATFPSGGIATLQGTGQIQNVTATSFTLKITLNTDGAWKIRVVNPDNAQSAQFAFNVQPSGPPPTGLPTSVLSPVIGPLRVTTSNQQIADGKWEFNQHRTGDHTPTGGISLSNDTYAWDANLYTATNSNADAGKAVFAAAAGQVVSYVGTQPGSGPGAVLIAHPNAANPVWFSGYLHMTNVRVLLNQVVDSTTVIGDVGRTGTSTDNLHFVVYSGTNTRGNLRSFNTVINERSSSTPSTISSINPSTVIQGDQLQTITINGSNFASDSILEVETPSGQSFTVTPQTISGFGDNSRIMQIAATTITANVRFAFSGTYNFTVINRSTGARSSGICPQICVNVTASSLRTPVILIPGIMGSRISNWNGTTLGEELWPASRHSELHRQLANSVNVENPDGPYRPIRERQVVATEIVRSLVGDRYGNLIDWLTTDGGYTLYNKTRPTLETCDLNQVGADLFVFPYDWRNSNWTSARDLDQFVQCIRAIRGNPAGFKVRIVAHSMGGLVARRYILNKKQDNLPHYVDRMVSLGTPWLGSPEIIPALQDGSLGWLNLTNIWISKSAVHEIAPYMRGAHELIPGYAYTDVLTGHQRGYFPFGEGGWDFNNNQRAEDDYDFVTLKSAMNQYGNSPGTHTDGFHSLDFDNWNRIDTGVDYYNFMGRSFWWGTIGSLVANKDLFGNTYLSTVPFPAFGDETVPEVSSSRNGLADYRGPGNIERWFNSNHGGLASRRPPSSGSTSNGSTFLSIKCVILENNPANCLIGLPSANGTSNARSLVVDPTYNLTVIGSNSVIFADSFNNTSDPLSTSTDEGIDTISTKVSGNSYVTSSIPLDQTYGVTITVPNIPFSIILLKNDGQTIVQAIRYVDVSLPPHVLALIQLSPQGVTTLAYDSDGNGTFDTPVNPTISVTGSQAQDVEPPEVKINESFQNGISRVVLEATDTGTGVRQIMYSLNGTTFQSYLGPLTIDPTLAPKIYVFADDNVFNRSGLITHSLTNSAAGFDISAPGAAPAGGVLNVSWHAPTGRPTDDWIGLFRVGALNSAYISKQYTGGAAAGNAAVIMPNQPGLYEFRYLINDQFTSVASSNPINVTGSTSTIFDFDGDHKADVSIFRPSTAVWWYLRSIDNADRVYQFGQGTDKLAPADFTGDGKTDVAFYRPSTGEWFVLRSEDAAYYAFSFGTNGDIPAPGDFDGDGKADAAVFRPSIATWFILKSTGGVAIQQFGSTGDVPTVADYDGDGKTDLGIYRPSLGQWWVQRSTAGLLAFQFGTSTDKPVQGDYTGDGKTDIAIWRPATGEWFVLTSETFGVYAFPFGTTGDIPAPGDYDGDGRTDAAVFRPSIGTWFMLRSTSGVQITQFGIAEDKPVPSAYVP